MGDAETRRLSKFVNGLCQTAALTRSPRRSAVLRCPAATRDMPYHNPNSTRCPIRASKNIYSTSAQPSHSLLQAALTLHAPRARDGKRKLQINTAINSGQNFFESRGRRGIVTRFFGQLMIGLSQIDTDSHCAEFALAMERRQ